MIELAIKKYLEEKLNVPILLEHQKEDPQKFIIFEKVSGGYKNKINTATFAFQSYGKSMFEAASLNEKLKIVLFKMTGEIDVGKVKLNSDYNFTDTTTKRYRYQAVFDITY